MREPRRPAHPRVLVVDVDNTLFDWVGTWAAAFRSMLATLAAASPAAEAWWVSAFKRVHEDWGATECPHALEAVMAAADAPEVPRSALLLAVRRYRRVWQARLCAYRGVRETLAAARGAGWRVVALTESDAAVTAARLEQAGLQGLIEAAFGPMRQMRCVDPALCLVDAGPPTRISARALARVRGKPHPDALLYVLGASGCPPEHALYVGDNLYKDLVMARRAGVPAVWAAYGTARNPHDAALLQRVAHWSPAATGAERSTGLADVHPQACLESFSELLDAIGPGRLATWRPH